MSTTGKIIKYQLRDMARSKWAMMYSLFFFVITVALFRFGGDSAKAMLSLMNVVLLIIPLISVVFGTMYFYNSREFIEFLLTQPVRRKHLFRAMYAGLTLPLTGGFALGTGIPFLYYGLKDAREIFTFSALLLAGIALTFIFVALAFAVSVRNDDRARGLGLAIFLWLACAVIYDGVILLIIYNFADYPLDKAVIALCLLNPIDLARIIIMLQFDVSALMGFTGAVFQSFFGSSFGIALSLASLAVWAAIPFVVSQKFFVRKDL